MRRIAVINQKGGVGKTTTAVNLGAALAREGKRVLLIDLDPQSHLTLHVGVDPATRPAGAYEALIQSTPLDEIRRTVADNLWLVGSHIDLAAAEVELVSVIGREVILRDLLDAHRADYDYVIMDCPPSLGVLTLNALAAANEIFIPLQPHYLALHGLSKLLETVSLVARRINPALRVTGVVVCMYEAGTRLATEVLEDVQSFLRAAEGGGEPWAGARVFRTVIRRNIKLAECPSHGKTIFDYEPKSNGAEDYAALAVEVRAMVEAGVAASGAQNPPASPKPTTATAAETALPPRARRGAATAEKPTAKPPLAADEPPRKEQAAPPKKAEATPTKAKKAAAGTRPTRDAAKADAIAAATMEAQAIAPAAPEPAATPAAPPVAQTVAKPKSPREGPPKSVTAEPVTSKPPVATKPAPPKALRTKPPAATPPVPATKTAEPLASSPPPREATAKSATAKSVTATPVSLTPVTLRPVAAKSAAPRPGAEKPRAAAPAASPPASGSAAEAPPASRTNGPEDSPDAVAALPPAGNKTSAPGAPKENTGREAVAAPAPRRRPKTRAVDVVQPVAKIEPVLPPDEPLSQTG